VGTLLTLGLPLMFLSATLAAYVPIHRWRLSDLCYRGAALAGDGRRGLVPGFRRLRLVRSQEAILERCTVKTSDDGIHLFRVGRVDEGKAFRLLCFWVADDFDIVIDKALGVQPALDVVLCHPDGKVSKKDSKAHSGLFSAPLLWILGSFADAIHEATLILTQGVQSRQEKSTCKCIGGKEKKVKLFCESGNVELAAW